MCRKYFQMFTNETNKYEQSSCAAKHHISRNSLEVKSVDIVLSV